MNATKAKSKSRASKRKREGTDVIIDGVKVRILSHPGKGNIPMAQVQRAVDRVFAMGVK